jgi:protein O-mannosyl-transferase
MPGPISEWKRATWQLLLAAAVFLLGLIAAYANHFQNGFHFDDAHTIVNNSAVRDLRNVPRFFTDATTFSALPSNQSYRPLVSTLLAIDYWLGRGLNPGWYHVSIFLFFTILVALLAYVIWHLIGAVTGTENRVWIALAAAALYAVHPANADTVNYVIASAEILATLGVIGSFALYFAFPRTRRFYLFVLPAALCILAKPPAAIFAVLFAIYRLLFRPNDNQRDLSGGAPRNASWLLDCLPPLVICGLVLWFVQRMTPHTWVAGAWDAHNYLITQPYVAWRYLRTFLWPSDLSADYDLDPFHSTDGIHFWTGFAFVSLFVVASIALCYKPKTRVIGFGLLWFLIGLLPTSLFPLAEVMNDHRAFIAYPGLVLALAGGASLLFQQSGRLISSIKPIIVGLALLVLCVSAYATFQRNKVWRDEETLWRDVTLKSPRNGRGLMNFGLTLMAKGDYQGALGYFHRAQVFTPQYPFLFVNLGIAEDSIGQTRLAEQHFREALRLAPTLPDAYSFYARFLIGHARQAEAQPLLRKAAELSPTDEMVRDLITESSAFSAETYLNLSLQRYRERRFDDAIAAARKALELRPDYAQAWNNIGAAYNDLGRFEEAANACKEALRLKPDFSLARNNLKYAEDHLSAAKATPGK